MGLQLEDLDAWRGGRRRVTRARGDPEPRQLEHPLRVLPGREVRPARRRRPGRSGRRSRRPRARRRYSGAAPARRLRRARRTRARAMASRSSAGASEGLCAGVGDDRDVKVVDAEVRHALASATWPRWRRRPPRMPMAVWCELGRRRVAPPRTRRFVAMRRHSRHHCHSSVSSPISTSWPLRAPAALSTASSSSPCGRLADDPEAAVGAVDPVRPARGRLRPVLEELRQLGRLLADGLGRGRAEPEERELQLVDAGAGGAGDREDVDDRARPRAGTRAAPGSRSILFRTIACGRSSRPAP